MTTGDVGELEECPAVSEVELSEDVRRCAEQVEAPAWGLAGMPNAAPWSSA